MKNHIIWFVSSWSSFTGFSTSRQAFELKEEWVVKCGFKVSRWQHSPI